VTISEPLAAVASGGPAAVEDGKTCQTYHEKGRNYVVRFAR
jgi:hypothetical protein